jgi:hypothetical protein
MHAGKLARMEDVRWNPPVLSFTIERHGAMGMGSTRAELQHWRVDLDRKTARCERSGSYRQALVRAEAVRVEPVARDLADSILAGRADDRLKWPGEETVRVLMMTKILPRDSGYMQTITGRRRRLRTALQTLLAEAGWREIRRDVYSKGVKKKMALRVDYDQIATTYDTRYTFGLYDGVLETLRDLVHRIFRLVPGWDRCFEGLLTRSGGAQS